MGVTHDHRLVYKCHNIESFHVVTRCITGLSLLQGVLSVMLVPRAIELG